MEIDFLDLNEDESYYEVEIWPNQNDSVVDSRYFTTLKEARAYFRKMTSGYEMDCIKHHKGAFEGWSCEIVK